MDAVHDHDILTKQKVESFGVIRLAARVTSRVMSRVGAMGV